MMLNKLQTTTDRALATGIILASALTCGGMVATASPAQAPVFDQVHTATSDAVISQTASGGALGQ